MLRANAEKLWLKLLRMGVAAAWADVVRAAGAVVALTEL
jgi:hypothetical protein